MSPRPWLFAAGAALAVVALLALVVWRGGAVPRQAVSLPRSAAGAADQQPAAHNGRRYQEALQRLREGDTAGARALTRP